MTRSNKEVNVAPSESYFDHATPVLVLNLGEYPFHQGSLGVIRSIGRLGVPVYTIHRDRFIPSAKSRYLGGRFRWALRNGDASQFIEGMAAIGRILGRPTVLIPTDDLSAILIAENAAAL